MPQEPAPATPGGDVPPPGAQPEPVPWEPVVTRPDPMSPAEWEAVLAASWDEVEPPGDEGEDYLDPEGSVLPPDEDLSAIEVEMVRTAAERAADAEFLTREGTAELAGRVAADQARKRGPRGPGLPGSADQVPGISGGPAGGVGAGRGPATRARPGPPRLGRPPWLHRDCG